MSTPHGITEVLKVGHVPVLQTVHLMRPFVVGPVRVIAFQRLAKPYSQADMAAALETAVPSR
jgi:hypothetical protein